MLPPSFRLKADTYDDAQMSQWERHFSEPLSTYSQFGLIIKKLLAYRHAKNVQYEQTLLSIESKRAYLATLERSEDEAKRVEDALQAVTSKAGPSDGTTESKAGRRTNSAAGSASSFEEVDAGEAREEPEASGSGSRPGDGLRGSLYAGTAMPGGQGSPSVRRIGGSGGSGYGFLSALSHSITGIMDVDPEATRRNNISKTKDRISQVCRPYLGCYYLSFHSFVCAMSM